jgi:hypothetical protein
MIYEFFGKRDSGLNRQAFGKPLYFAWFEEFSGFF